MTTPGRVWTVQANEGSDDCPLCFHAPDRHDGESCGVEVGYDHLNGSHECGCPLTAPARTLPPDCDGRCDDGRAVCTLWHGPR